MKTYSTRAGEVRRTWHVIDAAGVPLGRLASRAAGLIRGKHKVIYAPHLDTGDFVVVVNAANVALTGKKAEQKRYYSHSQYPGGLKVRSVREVMEKDPTRVVEKAVHGMLPHNSLGRSLHGHLKVYAGAEHPHAAQVNGPAQPALSQPPPPGRSRARRAAARPVVVAAKAAPAPVVVEAAAAAPITGEVPLAVEIIEDDAPVGDEATADTEAMAGATEGAPAGDEAPAAAEKTEETGA